MCNPALVVGLITVAMSAYQTDQANEAADEQAEALEVQAAANIGALDDKSEEVTSKANLEKFERKKQLQREVATTRASQSEGGALFGNTALRVIATTMMKGGQDLSLISRQEKSLQKQIGREKSAVAAGKDVQMSGLSWTSPLMAGLQAGTAGVSAYGNAGGTFGA